MDFVVGIRVSLSNNHNCKGMPAGAFVDICDELSAPYGFAPSDKRGLYPKDFKFTGWHPHCRCIATPVLKTMDELAADAQRIMAGDEPAEGSANEVTDVPQGFKQWVGDNQQRITTAKSLPYFIKDNKTWVDSLLHPQPRQLTTLQKAKLRHDARTQEQADKLKQRWEEHNKEIANTRMVGANVLKVAKDYGDVDYSALEALVASGNPNGMRQAAKAVAKQVQEAKKFEASISDLIPDAHKWHQQFTRAELQKAHDSVVAKLGYWKKHGKGSLTDGTDLVDLNYVAYKQVDYLNLNKNNVQATKVTWKVEAQAYEKVAKDALDKWHWQIADADLAALKIYNTSSKKFKELISAAHDAKKTGDLTLLRSKISEAEKLKWDLEDKKAKAAAKKAAAASDVGKEEAYTQARKDKALWSTKKEKDGTYTKKVGDDYFRPFAEKDWARWSENEKDVAYLYTSGSCYINEPLYTKYYGKKYGLHGEVRKSWDDINTLTKMIDQSTPFTRDVWLNRGASPGEFVGQFGVDLDDLIADPSKVNGLTGEQKPFMSTAHSKSWGFVDKGKKANPRDGVVYNIYCPKGTKGIYTEPFSAFGHYKRTWDGKATGHLKEEVEVVLQRGTQLRVTKVYKKGNVYFVDMEVIGQPIKKPNAP